MAKRRRYGGFSLVEVLLAVGTLAIGMIFIGGTFLVGIHLTTVSTERTIATVVANEAFAKVELFGVDLADPKLADDHLWPLEDLVPSAVDPDEFAYPSTRTLPEKQYFWSALCRRYPSDPNHDVQVTVFVSRKVGAASKYIAPLGSVIDRPVAVQVGVSGTLGSRLLTITGDPGWISAGSTIAEDSTGEIYRVVDNGAGPAEILLDPDKPWLGGNKVWVVPPPIGRGRGPCIAVYQKVIRF
jgi:hypothetical protein